ncbi:MAG: TIM barrel protein [Pseudomonadota bacterium]
MPDPAADRALSLSYYTVPELSFSELVDVAADAGCRHVGVRLLHGAPTEAPTGLLASPAARREAVARMNARGITPLEASAARIRPLSVMDDFSAFLEACAEIGARHVMCTLDDADVARADANLARLCEMAVQFDLRIEIEFVPWMTVASLNDAMAVVRRVGSANLGIALDALHFDRSSSRVADLANVPASVLGVVQICDAAVCTDFSAAAQMHVATEERLFPGEGQIDLRGMLRAVPSHLPLALEIPTATLARTMPAAQRVARAVEATRRVLEGVQRG